MGGDGVRRRHRHRFTAWRAAPRTRNTSLPNGSAFATFWDTRGHFGAPASSKAAAEGEEAATLQGRHGPCCRVPPPAAVPPLQGLSLPIALLQTRIIECHIGRQSLQHRSLLWPC